MERTKKHTGRTVLLIVLAILILLPAACYGYLALSRFDEAVTMETIEAQAAVPYAGERAFSKDGDVTVLLRENDVYWLVNEYDVLQELDAYSGVLLIHALGVGFTEGGLDLYVHGKLLGFLPAPLHISANADFAGDELRLTIADVTLGKSIHISPERLASFGIDSVFSIDADELGLGGNDTRSIVFTADGVEVTRTTLGKPLSDVFAGARALPEALSVYGRADLFDGNPLLMLAADYRDASANGRELAALTGSASDPDATLIAFLAAGDPDTVQSALAAMEPFDRHFLIAATDLELSSARSKLLDGVAESQSAYEALLIALRDKYRAFGLTLSTGGFLDSESGEPFTLSTLSALAGLSDAESRALLLYSKDAAHAVKTADMPLLSDIPVKSRAALQDMYDGIPYDLGILTKLPSGQAALLYYEATGTFIVHCMSDELYESLLTATKQPFVFMDSDLPRPPTRAAQDAPKAGLSPYEVLLPVDAE